MNSHLPIGIFDSGVGGLTVYRALRERLPNECFIYLGDTARVTYGTKSLSTVERYAIENARFLCRHGIKLLVVACNTASALALPAVERNIDVPVIGVIDAGARAAVEEVQGRIGVIATEATIGSGAYRQAILKIAPNAEVFEQACPLFVPLAEEGWADSEVAQKVADEYLHKLRDLRISKLILGCTHYPVLRQVIQGAIGDQVRLIDAGPAVAREVEATLIENKLQRHPAESQSARQIDNELDRFYVTDAAQRFARIACMFLGSAPRVLEAVELQEQI